MAFIGFINQENYNWGAPSRMLSPKCSPRNSVHGCFDRRCFWQGMCSPIADLPAKAFGSCRSFSPSTNQWEMGENGFVENCLGNSSKKPSGG